MTAEPLPEAGGSAGDAFFEPAHARITHFDALDEPAKFVACYLLGKEEQDLIVIVP